MKRYSILLFLFTLISTCLFSQPKNIIIIMSDGMGFNHSQLMDKTLRNGFDVQYAVSNYPTYWDTLKKPYNVHSFRGDYHVRRVWQEFAYSDSLPINAITAGSAIATGIKPAFNSVSFDMDETLPETILERAISLGKSTGIATDRDIYSDNSVTPFLCHAKNATNFTDLFNQIINSSANIVLTKSSSITNSPNETWTFVNSTESVPTSLSKSLLISDSTLTTLKYNSYLSSCLNALNTNNNGFVFVSEFSAIDNYAKQQNVEGTILAMSDFESFTENIISWIEANSSWNETLLIVVGSYEQGYLTSSNFNKEQPLNNYLADGNNIKYNSQYATNLLTPLYAKGKGCELFQNYIDETDFVLGSYINNTEIAQVCFRLLPKTTIKRPKNIIFMVNDGCGIAPIKATDYYTGKTQEYENFPVLLWNCTHASASTSVVSLLNSWNNTYESNLAWTGKDYLWARKNATCSGASGTAMATGKKTYYYSLGVDLKDNSLYSIAQYAKSLGKSAGVATNAPFNDATPGAFFTNNVSREELGSLARQVIIESVADVVIGCNHPEYDKNATLKTNPDYSEIGGIEMLQGLRDSATEYSVASNSGWTTVRDIDGDNIPDPWTFVEDSAGLVKYMTGETPKRLFGLMPVDGSMQFYRTGTNVNEVHFDDWNPQMPRLWQIAKTAINCLDDNENGFFVMIEGDMVDNSGHKNYAGRLIEEQMEFNTAVDSVIAWINTNSSWDETLLIITADHETGLIADPTFAEDSIFLNHWELIDNGKGNMPGLEFYSLDHSNQLVPLFAKGAGSELLNTYADEWDYIRGKYLNNSEIGQTMFELWNGTACSFTNESPKCEYFDTLYLKQQEDFNFNIPEQIISDVEDNDDLIIKLISKPTWVKYDEENFALFGTSPKALGVTNTTFTATDGKTTGASITTTFVVKICVYKETSSNIDETAEKEFAIYPNPAIVKITIETEKEEGFVLIRDMQGRIVNNTTIKSKQTEIAVDNLKPGEYIIQVFEGDIVTSKKIIIK